ncbi:MAG: hypothetical protein K2G12_06940, partial [Prevotella sp.]|nr:hypothetical protein [Prevotella sp.]
MISFLQGKASLPYCFFHIFKTSVRRAFVLIFIAIGSAAVTGCVNEEEFENTSSGNFEALWKIMDEHYCFFELKEKELGVNWDEVHGRYSR